mmetsp:Transcript_33971/g.66985  ORF Transcript_33971/g.66985 Transcript_33971/m.66985 type:complete len:87 (+) Transcript_33971:835-1095(+)
MNVAWTDDQLKACVNEAADVSSKTRWSSPISLRAPSKSKWTEWVKTASYGLHLRQRGRGRERDLWGAGGKQYRGRLHHHHSWRITP